MNTPGLVPGKLYRISGGYDPYFTQNGTKIPNSFICFDRSKIVRVYREDVLMFVGPEYEKLITRFWFLVKEKQVNTGWFLEEKALAKQFERIGQ